MKSIDAVRPWHLQHYLERHGWSRIAGISDDDVDVYETSLQDEDGKPVRLFVPASTELDDFARMRDNLINALSEIEERPVDAIVHDLDGPDIVGARTDVFMARILVSGGGDRLGFRGLLTAYHALFDLFAYAATAEIMTPVPYFSQQHKAARRFANELLIPAPARGSFVLQVESPVDPFIPLRGRHGRGAPNTPEPSPFARRVMVRVLRGLRDVLRSGQDAERLDQLFVEGLNANMCEALGSLHEALQDTPVDFGVSWSPRAAVPQDLERLAPIRYERRTFEAVREVGSALRQPTVARPQGLTGYVVELRAKRSAHAISDERRVILSTEVEGRTHAVEISLEERDYQVACDAHRDRRPVRVEGLLERIGKHWQLTRYQGFGLVG
ncbi:hypothetical protein WME98_53135 [Sorangium sp. So ce296]|uniref:hypothetical protein n=1 Tax=Sorangium sp. So ce296 TaxID=3133296 RepID=UPI003F62C871